MGWTTGAGVPWRLVGAGGTVASNMCVAPCTVTVPCSDPMAGTGKPEETVTGLGIAPCTEGASDTRLPRALETEAQAT
jgi:hypothetical protein